MLTKMKVYQGKDYLISGNPNRLNDYHIIWYVGRFPIKQMWIRGVDDWTKDNTFRGMTVIKWDGEEEKIKQTR